MTIHRYFILFFFYSLSIQAKVHQVVMERHLKRGDRYNMTATQVDLQNIEISVEGVKPTKNKTLTKTVLKADVTILKVDKAGTPVELEAVIEELRVQIGEPPIAAKKLLAVNTPIFVRQNKRKGEILINKKPVTAEVFNALHPFFLASRPRLTGQDVCAPKGRRKVGDTWPIDAKTAVKRANANGHNMKPDDVAGKSIFVELTNVDGVDAMVIKQTINFGKPSPINSLPMGVNVDNGDMKICSSVTVPIDQRLYTLKEEITVTHSAKGSGKPGKDGPEVTMSVQHRSTLKVEYHNLTSNALGNDAKKAVTSKTSSPPKPTKTEAEESK